MAAPHGEAGSRDVLEDQLHLFHPRTAAAGCSRPSGVEDDPFETEIHGACGQAGGVIPVLLEGRVQNRVDVNDDPVPVQPALPPGLLGPDGIHRFHESLLESDHPLNAVVLVELNPRRGYLHQGKEAFVPGVVFAPQVQQLDPLAGMEQVLLEVAQSIHPQLSPDAGIESPPVHVLRPCTPGAVMKREETVLSVTVKHSESRPGNGQFGLSQLR